VETDWKREIPALQSYCHQIQKQRNKERTNKLRGKGEGI